MNILEHLVNGNMAAARMLSNGVNAGDTVIVNTGTAPTRSGFCELKATVKEVFENGSFRLDQGDPYFSYTLYTVNDIIG